LPFRRDGIGGRRVDFALAALVAARAAACVSIVNRIFTRKGGRSVRKYAIPAVVIAALASGGAAFANSHSPRPSRGKARFTVIKLFAPTAQLKLIDLGDPGFSLGDESVFSDNLLTRRNGSMVGFDGGVCTVARVANAATLTGTLQCLVTFSLNGGQIATQAMNRLTNGQFTGTQPAAVTGGTGRFRGAKGEVAVQFLSNNEANVTFLLTR
jgi:hypothetical protein